MGKKGLPFNEEVKKRRFARWRSRGAPPPIKIPKYDEEEYEHFDTPDIPDPPPHKHSPGTR